MKEFIHDVIHILYIHWSVALVLTGVALFLALFLGKAFVPKSYRMMTFVYGVIFILALPIFYFGISVPDSVQTDHVLLSRMYKAENPEYKDVFVAIEKANACNDGKLNSYEYFLLSNAIIKDMELAFNKQKGFSTVPKANYADPVKSVELICSS